MRRRQAAPPPPEWEEARRKNREEARKSAAPPQRRPVRHFVATKAFRVVSERGVHGKKKGEVVELPATGATSALVEGGHLVPVEREAANVKAEPEKEANDG